MNKKRDMLPQQSEWTANLINDYFEHIERIATEYLQLDTYPNQIEIISAEQMMDAYSSVGLPIMYDHWSFGKSFIKNMESYTRGQMGLAYEIVINSNPSRSYLMEENTLLMQIVVLAHVQGHNAFFKNNYLFKQWTDASAIIPYCSFAKKYIAHCEERYGYDAVEEVLDACHALQNYGIDKYTRPKPLSSGEETQRIKERNEFYRKHFNELWCTIPQIEPSDTPPKKFPEEPQENILYFLEKHSPHLETWKREIIRIVRKLSQYFYPQKQTKVANEGYASITHYEIIHKMHEEGLIGESFMLEFYENHSAVINQFEFDDQRYQYTGLNVYALGFAIFKDIKRICLEPTEEDKEWFPEWAGCKDWVKIYHWAAYNFKDESFIRQFLSPKVIRDLKLFSFMDDEQDDMYEITAIHNKQGYKKIRETLANQYDINYIEPQLSIQEIDVRGDRSMTLHHHMINNMRLAESDDIEQVMKHLAFLWGFDVHLHSVTRDENGEEVIIESCHITHDEDEKVKASQLSADMFTIDYDLDLYGIAFDDD